MNYSIRWAQLRPKEGPEAYDFAFAFQEAVKLAVIWVTAWYVITTLF